MATPTVILDACVLYPAPLRDLLLWLAVTGLYRPRWTETIHQEWMENLFKKRPDLDRDRLERTNGCWTQRRGRTSLKLIFTGAPIMLKDANRRAVFGEYINICDIKQAVDDLAVRGSPDPAQGND